MMDITLAKTGLLADNAVKKRIEIISSRTASGVASVVKSYTLPAIWIKTNPATDINMPTIDRTNSGNVLFVNFIILISLIQYLDWEDMFFTIFFFHGF